MCGRDGRRDLLGPALMEGSATLVGGVRWLLTGPAETILALVGSISLAACIVFVGKRDGPGGGLKVQSMIDVVSSAGPTLSILPGN